MNRYLHQNTERPAWALVTGASDGIGFGFVQELSERGFNVILHGRNEGKLNGIKDQLKITCPDRDFRVFIQDAEKELTDDVIHYLQESIKDIHLTVLINNVGGQGSVKSAWQPFLARSSSDIDKCINMNSRFATQITRALMPALIENAPAFILNVSSFGGVFNGPYISVYAGAKAYILAWSASLKAEMRVMNTDVEVLSIIIARVNSGSVDDKVSFWTLSSRDMAKAALDQAGCGKKMVTPAWSHAIQKWILDWLPESLLETVLIKAVTAEKERSKTLRTVEI